MFFWKYQGLGNDFILIEQDIGSKHISDICDRKYGIGADGIIILKENIHNKPQMIIYNSDGSRAEICGNGLRCLLLHLYKKWYKKQWEINTDCGKKNGEIIDIINENEITSKVSIGNFDFSPQNIPINSDEPIINQDITFQNKTLNFTAVSVGNPHIVTFDKVTSDEIETLSPIIGNHALFPEKINIGWAQWDQKEKTIKLTVWERGAGFTLACGSGASAALIAAYKKDYVEINQKIIVKQKGGDLIVWIDREFTNWIQGNSRFVFKGEFFI